MTKRTESRGKRKHEPWQGATRALLLGCVAELYLLMIHKYYIYGNLDQVLAWDSYLRVSLWLGLGVAVLGGVLLYGWLYRLRHPRRLSAKPKPDQKP